MKGWYRILGLGCLSVFLGVSACTAPVDEITGPSFQGFTLAVTAQYGAGGLVADGASQATIRIELVGPLGPVDGEVVTLTTTLGTLADATVTTALGVAVTTLTAGTVEGTAYIVATVDNISSNTSVPILKF